MNIQDVNARNDQWETPLYTAAAKGDVAEVGELLKAGAKLNSQAKKRFTPLHAAARFGHVNVMKVLIDAGAGLNLLTIRQMTPLIVACKFNQPSAAILLLKSGCAVNAGDMFQRTALHWAIKVSGDETYLFDALISHGADISAVDKFNKTPVLQAVKSNRPTILGRLLDLGADYSTADRMHRQPIHMAAERGRRRCLDILINKAHVSVDTPTENTLKTPLMLASSAGREHTLQYLVDEGADANVKDNRGMTALHGLILAILTAHRQYDDGTRELWCRMALALVKANTNLESTSDWPAQYFNDAASPPLSAMETALRAKLYDLAMLLSEAGSKPRGLLRLFAMKTKEQLQYGVDLGYLDWFRRNYRSPPSLMELSRVAFYRGTTSRHFARHFLSLPGFPAWMREYVLYGDLAGKMECGSGAELVTEAPDDGQTEDEESDTEEEMEPSVFDSDLYGGNDPPQDTDDELCRQANDT